MSALIANAAEPNITPRITEKIAAEIGGRALREELRVDARASQERILAPLAPKDRRPFLDMLSRLVEVHEAYARPGNGRRSSLESPSSRSVAPPSD
jgi:hypothetical protein